MNKSFLRNLLWIWACAVALPSFGQSVTVPIFHDTAVHFLPDSADKYLRLGEKATDNGRVVSTTVDLPQREGPVRITAHVVIHPIPKDDRSVWDRWDRAGNLRLAASLIERFPLPSSSAAEQIDDLVQFSLGAEYERLRERLGVAVR